MTIGFYAGGGPAAFTGAAADGAYFPLVGGGVDAQLRYRERVHAGYVVVCLQRLYNGLQGAAVVLCAAACR